MHLKAIRRIIRDCNGEIIEGDANASILLPRFSCHSLRHTFATRMCEKGVNIKVIQDVMGHTDISTTMNVYTDVTKEDLGYVKPRGGKNTKTINAVDSSFEAEAE